MSFRILKRSIIMNKDLYKLSIYSALKHTGFLALYQHALYLTLYHPYPPDILLLITRPNLLKVIIKPCPVLLTLT